MPEIYLFFFLFLKFYFIFKLYIIVLVLPNIKMNPHRIIQGDDFSFQYRFLKRQVRWSGIPISLRVFQFVVIHTVKGFGIVNKAEIDTIFFLVMRTFLIYPLSNFQIYDTVLLVTMLDITYQNLFIF